MNVVPKLIDQPSWATIASFSGNEMLEFAMFVALSVVIVGGVVYGVYRAFKP